MIQPLRTWVFILMGFLVAMGTGRFAFAGGESSAGGAEDYRVLPAFFRGWQYQPKPVKACYEIAPNFGIDDAFVVHAIKQSFQQWGDYIRLKRLTIVPTNHLMIQTQLDLHLQCQGDENLVFYMGVENETIAHYRGQFSQPYGFAQLVTPANDGIYPPQEARALIWIAPSGGVEREKRIPHWSSATQDAFAGLLLHEVGHVFGNSHVDGTVMTEKIGRYLENDTDPSKRTRNVELYSKIDSQIELVPCMECRMSYLAAETFDPIQPPGQDSDWIRTFRMLVGQEPVAPMVIRYERLGSPQGSGKLTLMDAMGSYVFPVNVESQIAERRDSAPLFYGQGNTSFYSFGMSYYARIRPLVGSDIAVAVNYNMDGKKAGILPLGDGFYPHPIFVSAN